MTVGNVLSIVSIILFIGARAILSIFRFRRNVHYIPFEMNTLIKTTDDLGVKNYIYATHGQTAEYIKKYIIRKSVNDDSFICNFIENYDEIQYYLIQYNKRRKPINVKLISEYYTNNSSKIIVLKKKCKYINVIIKRINDKDINNRVIMPLSVKNIRAYSLCAAVALFAGTFALSHYIIKLICGMYAKTFFYSAPNYIGIGVLAVVSILAYDISVANLRRKNSKTRNGGALEYEFF